MPNYYLGIADLHEGSEFALVPPPEQRRLIGMDRDRPAYNLRRKMVNRLRKQQADHWAAFVQLLKQIPKCKAVFILGDLGEGTQKKTGGAQLITPNVDDQKDMTLRILRMILKSAGYPPVFGCRGTGYHVTGPGGQEYEDAVYADLNNIVGWDDVMSVKAGGIIWRLQHFVPRSSVPYGKQTPLAKEIVMNTLQAAAGIEHDADVMLYGHVHYSVLASYPMAGKTAVSLPTLKLRGEQYGRKYHDFYDVGLLLFEQERDGDKAIRVRPLEIGVHRKLPKLWKVK